MTGHRMPRVGFMLPKPRPRCIAAVAALITTAALVVSITIAATVVSIGITRAAPAPQTMTVR